MGRVNVSTLNDNQLHQMRMNMQMIFQDPYSSLNPRFTLLQIVGEPLLVNGVAKGSELQDRVAELLQGGGAAPGIYVALPARLSVVVSASASAWRAPWRSTRSW